MLTSRLSILSPAALPLGKYSTLSCIYKTSTSKRLSYLSNRRSAPPALKLIDPLCTQLRPSSASSSAASGLTSSQIHSQPNLSLSQLTWNRFLQLRAVRRRYNLVASLVTSGLTTFGGIVLLGQQDLDGLGNLLFGLDPIMAMGLGVAACGAMGWLIGPFAGNAAFSFWYRRLGREIAEVSRHLLWAERLYRARDLDETRADRHDSYRRKRISIIISNGIE